MLPVDTAKLIPVMKEAGELILSLYNHQGEFTLKEDRSPVTVADRQSNEFLLKHLRSLAPQIPVLSEESEHASYEERRKWNYYFLIDPLDGTKGYVKRNNEFTINLALIEKNRAVMGMIYVPIDRTLYVAERGSGCFKIENDLSERLPFNVGRNHGMKVVLSRSDTSPKLDKLLEEIPGVVVEHTGSSKKFCLIAEGSADFYPRKTGSMEWDVAAGTIIVEESGGEVLLPTGDPISYNKRELLNSPFLVFNSDFQRYFGDLKTRIIEEFRKNVI